MADPIVTRILDNVVTTLRGVTKAAGYHRTLRRVEKKVALLSGSPPDYAFVAAMYETKKDLASNRKECRLTLAIECVIEDGSDTERATHEAAADIEAALESTATRGRLAEDTVVTGVEYEINEDLTPIGACRLEVQVVYRHRRANLSETSGG